MKQKGKRMLAILLVIASLLAILPNLNMPPVSAATGNQVLIGKRIETVYGDALKASDGKVYYEEPIVAVNFKNGAVF